MEELFHEKSVTGTGAWNRLFDETIGSLRFTVEGWPSATSLASRNALPSECSHDPQTSRQPTLVDSTSALRSDRPIAQPLPLARLIAPLRTL